jgi:hypothetical protein
MDNIELAATFCTFSNIDLDWLKAGAEDELKLALELDMEGDERGQRVLASDPSERHSDTPWCLLARSAPGALTAKLKSSLPASLPGFARRCASCLLRTTTRWSDLETRAALSLSRPPLALMFQ